MYEKEHLQKNIKKKKESIEENNRDIYKNIRNTY